jgi:cytochrome b subunit of formate dehydrogenase
MQPFRFLLYSLSAVSGVVGLIVGGGPVIDYAWRRVFGMSYSVEWDQLFRSAVILFLSLIVLILVHLGHRLAGAFDIGLPKKPETEGLPKKSEI